MRLTRLIPALFGTCPRANALVATTLVLTSLVPLVIAQEPAASRRTSKAMSAKGVDRTPAMTINFPKSLGLPFDSLLTLGSRIEQALKVPDPVCLMGLAKELSVCEQVSGKTASLTSDTLYKEAVALAEVRGISAELKAVALYAKDDETSKKLGKLAEAAEKRDNDARRASESGERTRGIKRFLRVHNNTGYQILIYDDGRQLGWVNPYDNFQFFVRDPPFRNSVITGTSADGSMSWGPFIYDQNPLDIDLPLN